MLELPRHDRLKAGADRLYSKHFRQKAFAVQVLVRDYSADDIQSLVDYWYKSPRGFIESLRVDASKFPAEERFVDMQRDLVRKWGGTLPSKMPVLTLELSGRAIGVHLVNALEEGIQADFHAHLWFEEHRGKGIALQTYVKAFQIFFDRFALEKIHLKTPVSNIAGNKVLDKLGIPISGQMELHGTILRDGTIANHRILTRLLLEQISRNQPGNS